MKRVWRIISTLVSIAVLVGVPASSAWAIGCPSGMSQMDCAAINGNLVNWVPDNGSGACGSSSLVGNDNMQKAFNFLLSHGLTGPQAAGIIGNTMVEDPGLVPDTVQGGGHSETMTPGVGYGIVQWTTADRQAGLTKQAQTDGGKISDLSVQLDFMWTELNSTYKSALTDLQSGHIYVSDQDAAYNAAVSILLNYETPADHAIDGPNAHVRGGNADSILKTYGSSSDTSSTAAGDAGDICPGGSVSCNDGTATSSNLSPIRQKVVCLAQQELALWRSQPGYGNPYPGFPYAQNGFLKYSDNAYQEWCADFVSWIYKQAGDPFTGGESGGWRYAAVSEIMSYGQASTGGFTWHTSNYTPRPGDIVIFKDNGASHTNLVVSVVGTTVNMIGGDQGSGPYGDPGPPPESGSIVSTQQVHGFLSNNITGYVSPD